MSAKTYKAIMQESAEDTFRLAQEIIDEKDADLLRLRLAASEADALRTERDELNTHLSACRSECDQLRAEWNDVIERMHAQARQIEAARHFVLIARDYAPESWRETRESASAWLATNALAPEAEEVP